MGNRRVEDPQTRTDRATFTLPESVLDHIEASLRDNGGKYNSRSEWVTKWCLIGVAAERGCLDAYAAELERDHRALMAGVEIARDVMKNTPIMEAPAAKQFKEATPEVLLAKIRQGEPVVPKDVSVAVSKSSMFTDFKGWHTKRGISMDELEVHGQEAEDWLTGGRKKEFDELFGGRVNLFLAEYEVFAAMGGSAAVAAPAAPAPSAKPKHDASDAKRRALKERAKKVAIAYSDFFKAPVGSEERSHCKSKVVAYTKEAGTLVNDLPEWGWDGFAKEVLSQLAERLGGISEGDGKWLEIERAIHADIQTHQMGMEKAKA